MSCHQVELSVPSRFIIAFIAGWKLTLVLVAILPLIIGACMFQQVAIMGSNTVVRGPCCPCMTL